jgi:DNA-binding NarL/FixJ family response regulator
MIDQISSGGILGATSKSLADLTKAPAPRTENALIRSEKAPEKQVALKEDSVQLSPSAQARNLRREGKSIPQIAIQLGLSIPTVDAFFKE